MCHEHHEYHNKLNTLIEQLREFDDNFERQYHSVFIAIGKRKLNLVRDIYPLLKRYRKTLPDPDTLRWHVKLDISTETVLAEWDTEEQTFELWIYNNGNPSILKLKC